MRVTTILLALVALAISATAGEARAARHHHARAAYSEPGLAAWGWGATQARPAYRSRRPSVAGHEGDPAYRLAASQGGVCGLTVERLIFGRSDHILNGWNPWLANEWLRFQRAAPIAGMVAVWPGRHVEIIMANNGDGTVATQGSVGFTRVSLRKLIVVDPYSSPRRRYASR